MSKISKDLENCRFPDILDLKKTCKSIAVLDSILMPDWELRYYSYNAKWSIDCELASMRDGSGEEYSIHFSPIGAFIKGYVHESRLEAHVTACKSSWSIITSQIPIEFHHLFDDPAFSLQESNFFLWKKESDLSWNYVKYDFCDFSEILELDKLLCILDGNPKTYKHWAEGYYEKEISLISIEHIYAQRSITNKLIDQLNSEIFIKDLINDLVEIDYTFENLICN